MNAIKGAHITGTQLYGRCPFHDDSHSSFSANLETGLWKCHAEDIDGNFIHFYAKFNRIGTKEAYKQIVDKYGQNAAPQVKAKSKKEPPLAPLTLEQYAEAKKLPPQFLVDQFRLETKQDYYGVDYLSMPYLSADGKQKAIRKRYSNKAFRWGPGEPSLYGEWMLADIRSAGYVILVEGESDTQTLWYLGIPALGVPGASMFKTEWVSALHGLKVYIHVEPDAGGETFAKKVSEALRKTDFKGEVHAWSCSDYGVKDPSELYVKVGIDDAERKLRELITSAEMMGLNNAEDCIDIPGIPIRLKPPKGWICAEDGICKGYPGQEPVLICRTPIVLTRRLSNRDAGDEKMEVAFLRDGTWQTAAFPRSVLFSSRGVVALADLGCTVTSSNSKALVDYFGALEAENIEVIPKVAATSALGWQPGGYFIPGCAGNIVLDIDPSLRAYADAYSQRGTLAKWVEHIAPCRDNPIFRCVLAASFAAPLLQLLSQRTFVLHNWGDSRGGKTATLKAALSVWGDPDRLMVSFYSTQVGLERTAAFYHDLPLGIDERQLAGDKQADLEKIVYMLSAGAGKTRGAKAGGIQPTTHWRTIALCTGEEPISNDASQSGVGTRVLEIFGSPFSSEGAASAMHRYTSQDYGTAGPSFIDQLRSLDKNTINEAYNLMLDYIHNISDGKNGAHVTALAVIALAEAMIDSWFFDNVVDSDADVTFSEQEAAVLEVLQIAPENWKAAKQLVESILKQVQADAVDVNANAVQHLADWILVNDNFFGQDLRTTCFGFYSDDRQTVYILCSVFNRILKDGNFNVQKTKKYLNSRNLIETTKDKNGKTEFTVCRRYHNQPTRVVGFRLGAYRASQAGEDERV